MGFNLTKIAFKSKACAFCSVKHQKFTRREKKTGMLTKCLAALILTRPSRLVSLPCDTDRSSNDINVRHIGKFDCRITFTNSFEIVSRFFSKNPVD